MGSDTGIIFDSGKILFHGRGISERAGRPVIGQDFPFMKSTLHPIDMGIFRVHFIKAELKSDIG